MGILSRNKGKRIERDMAFILRKIFPEVARNANEQSQMGGVDLKGTQPFAFEVKGGKYGEIVKVRRWLDQAKSQATPEYPKPIVLVRPDRRESYAIMDMDVLLSLLSTYKRHWSTKKPKKTP